MNILVHGYSNVVLFILKHAAEKGVRFKVIVTEGQPERDGYKTAQALQATGIPVELVLDTAVGFVMDVRTRLSVLVQNVLRSKNLLVATP